MIQLVDLYPHCGLKQQISCWKILLLLAWCIQGPDLVINLDLTNLSCELKHYECRQTTCKNIQHCLSGDEDLILVSCSLFMVQHNLCRQCLYLMHVLLWLTTHILVPALPVQPVRSLQCWPHVPVPCQQQTPVSSAGNNQATIWLAIMSKIANSYWCKIKPPQKEKIYQ
jgi:hypothetical protein